MTTRSEPILEVPLQKPSDWHILVRCFKFLRPYWHLAVGTYLTMLIITGLTLTIPQFIRWIVDRGIGEGNVSLLGWSVAALLGVTVVKGVLAYFQGRWSEVMSQGVAYDLRNLLHNKLADLSFSYHDRTETGQLLSRAVQDVDRVRFLTGRAVLRLLDSTVLGIGTAIVLFTMSPTLAAAGVSGL
jgi:ABC-type multidrug transport system fused ATPase/permease subunit